ncbi:hypothetical protein G6011_06302 [Alternaria panax]|uniref:Uncharacterized protein n=1 Tax=Alternaria panax TaxID=48097 RepID=A0AAD4I9Q3_9PLEO|nr:hypothetical protein G6011_06302 [Alternaria panax]
MASLTPVLFELEHRPHIKTHNHFCNARKLGWTIEACDWDNIGFKIAPSLTIYELADVYINNAPLVDMLLRHTRVYEGFRNSTSLGDLAMTVSINLGNRQLHTDTDDQRPLYNVLKYVRHVTLFLELSPDTMNPELVGREQDKMTSFVTRIAEATPYTKMFRIALKYPRGLITDTELQDQLHEFNPGRPILTDSFNAFGHLHLMQVGKGCGVGYGGVALHKLSKHPGGQTFINGSGYPVVLNHAVYQVAAYTYGIDKEETTKYAWKEDEAGGWWPRSEYPDVVVASVDAEKSWELMQYPEKVLGWVEASATDGDEPEP